MTERANFRNVISIPQAKHLFGRGNYINNDLYLVDNIKGSNLPQNFKEAKCIVILFCERGGFKYDSKGSTIYASQNDLVFFTDGQDISHLQALSDSYLGQAIFISTNALSCIENRKYNENCLLHRIRKTNKIKLSQQEMDTFNDIFTLINEGISSNTDDNQIIAYIKLIIAITQLIFNKDLSSICQTLDYDEQKYQQFINLVEEKLILKIPISEYCQELDISETHLSHIVHLFAGITPLKYIHKILINRICIIAETTSAKSMPIYKIAERFHFRSASELSRFVKREIKISLSTYRCLESVEQQYIIHHTIFAQIV